MLSLHFQTLLKYYLKQHELLNHKTESINLDSKQSYVQYNLYNS